MIVCSESGTSQLPRGARRGRGRGVRTRGGRDGAADGTGASAAGPDPVVGAGRADGRQCGSRRAARGVRVVGAGVSRGTGSDRPGPSTVQELLIQNIGHLPMGECLEAPLHPYRPRRWQPYTLPSAPAPQAARPPSPMEVEAAPSPPPPSQPPLTPPPLTPPPLPSPSHSVLIPAMFVDAAQSPSTGSSGSQRPPSPTHDQSLNDDYVAAWLAYGSEPDSGDDDEEESARFPLAPRVGDCAFETPMDPEEEGEPTLAAAEAAPAAGAAPEADPAPTETDQPWGLYNFDWRPFPNVPISSRSRRERFTEIDVGPTTPCVDPYEIFTSIWDRQFMEYIASETNRYAQQVVDQRMQAGDLLPRSRISRWKDTTADELYTFFALIMAMGVVVKTRLEEYWSSTEDVFCTAGFRVRMSFDRFRLLSRYLHFRNNEVMLTLKLDASEAKLFKIQPVLSHLNDKFQSLYRLKQNIALDESLLLWKGCLDINQFIRNKAAAVGIKTYEICESQSGYLWRFEVHTHSQRSSLYQPEDLLNESTAAIVLRLIHGLEGKGHTLWMDNFYHSPALARHLKSIGVDCVGTLRTNRKFVPQALHSLTKESMRPGQISGLTSGDVDVMVWRDVNRVAMISTYHGNVVSNIRGSTKPVLIQDYNIMMGGVDKKDQMLSLYPIERKRTKIWYKKLFRRLLNVSVLNSFIIHRSSSPSFPDCAPLSHRVFRKTLVNALLSKHSSISIPRAIAPLGQPVSRVDVTHRLAGNPFGPVTVSGIRPHQRRKCVKCGKRGILHCVGCMRPVCMDPCFLAIHS